MIQLQDWALVNAKSAIAFRPFDKYTTPAAARSSLSLFRRDPARHRKNAKVARSIGSTPS